MSTVFAAMRELAAKHRIEIWLPRAKAMGKTCAFTRFPRPRTIIIDYVDTFFRVPVTTGTETDGSMLKATVAPIESDGEIPAELANQTMQLLRIHQVNGDLAWVQDMIVELEAQAKRTPPLGARHFLQDE